MEPKETMYPLYGGMRVCRRRSMTNQRAEEMNGCTCDNCTTGHDPLTGYPLAMVYSPEQAFENLYEPEEGLAHGTVFAALDFPFEGDGRRC